MMELVTIASGSSGNSALVSCPGGRLLIDAGVSMRRITAAVKAVGGTPEGLGGILLTHAHSDHINGLAMMTKYYHLPVYCTGDCAGELIRALPGISPYISVVEPGCEFGLSGMTARAFCTPHDSPGSVGWRLEAGGRTLAYVTDLGYLPQGIIDAVCGADTAVIEANHDINLLKSGPYPYYLKQRILSPNGHLSNADGGSLACRLTQTGCRRLILAHLSAENNTPRLAYSAVRDALTGEGAVVTPFSAVRDVPPCGDVLVTVAPRSEASLPIAV